MDKMIVVGSDNFEKFIQNDGYYVDKTELIYELVAGTRNEVTLFTRPRRFGKTLTMSMMESFFDIRRDSKAVFEGLDILKHVDFCRKWLNQYPVLFLSLKDVEGTDFDGAYTMLQGVISELCIRHSYLESDVRVDPADAETFRRLKFRASCNTEEEARKQLEETKTALKTIMRMMVAVYGKPVILLIDEYDVPLAKAEAAKNKEYYQKMLDVIRGMLSTSLKTNEYLKFAVITGCLRITKESIFTGVNNFACYSVLTRRFSKYFGFQQEEVQKMLSCFGMSEKFDIIKQWYDGYVFGNTEVFCPWDVASYMASVLDDAEEEPQNFWANTSSNAILDEFVNHPEIDATEKFEILLNGGTITQDIREELTYETMADSEKNLWSVLLMTGYVSKADQAPGRTRVKLRLPNAEIADLFRETVVERFNRRLDASTADAFLTAMWNKDEKTASNALSDILWNSISYFDYGEDYYHGLLNGIFTSRGYSPDSNDEAGLGRLDLRVKDRANRRILLLEFKRVKSAEELERGCQDAIAQIRKNGYADRMPEGYLHQVVYGIAFYGKQALVQLA